MASAALRSGVSQGVMQACWDAAGEVIKACNGRPLGGTDRTGNNELHGLRAILTLNIKKEGLAEMQVLLFIHISICHAAS